MLGFLRDARLLEREPRFFDFAFVAAGDGARAVREAAVAALSRAPETRIHARADLALASKQSGDRLAAVAVLRSRLGAEAVPILDRHEAAGEKSKAVLQAIATARATAAVGGGSEEHPEGAEGYAAFDGGIRGSAARR